ncbi:MAG: ABC transporter ATP-binding protein [Lachnospira sp.]
MKIAVKDISKAFDKKKYILKDLSLDVEDKSFTTLLGPSGCGKTTLLRMIAGLETPDTGEIWFDDRCVFSRERGINIPPEKRNIGFVFQDFALWPHMTVFENVAFGLRAKKNTSELNRRVMDALEVVQLSDFAERFPAQLSGGQQQRVSFARAIALNPECILFDEPLSALDAVLRDDMRTEIRKITKDMGVTSLFVTHDQSEAMSMSDSIVVMNGGRIEQKDKPENVYRNPMSVFVAKFVGKSNWIDENHMFRPEDATVESETETKESEENKKLYLSSVISSQFMGMDYEVVLNHNGNKWYLRLPHRVETGSEIGISVNSDRILTF